jgi:hypothetical protein
MIVGMRNNGRESVPCMSTASRQGRGVKRTLCHG